MLDYTINILEEHDGELTLLEEMLNAYIQGDIEAIYEYEFKDFDEADPLYQKFWSRLGIERNIIMAQRIKD